MIFRVVTTFAWGVVSSIAALVISSIFYVSKKSIQNSIVFAAFVLGCVRGYTGKALLE
jgi:RsiW-degrading membrane proteinase PrsW (M82 family)